jgi:hypothetical protein
MRGASSFYIRCEVVRWATVVDGATDFEGAMSSSS